MKTYTILKAAAPFDWKNVRKLAIDTPYMDTPSHISAEGKIAYDDTALYIHLSTKEKDYLKTRTGLLDEPCADSCLEFFFRPMEFDKRYMNIEYNANGCMYIGLGTCLDDLVRIIPDTPAAEIFTPRITEHDDGWEIEYRIPVSFVRRFFPGFRLEEGKTIRANCYKCADESVPPHYMSWSPILEDKLTTFHQSEFFGEMILS